MEETFETENPLPEVKTPDNDTGGIGRRLRDRDLLRKRKAEAEEKATNQAQSRKRARKEPSSTPGRKGRPRKNAIPAEPQPDQGTVQPADQPEILTALEDAPSAPIPLSVSVPAPAPVPQTVFVPEPIPAMIAQPAEPLTIPGLEEESNDDAGGVLIEDLGPDEEDDKPVSQERLVIDQGAVEEPPADLTEQTKLFSEPVLATPIAPPAAPVQPEYLPEQLL